MAPVTISSAQNPPSLPAALCVLRTGPLETGTNRNLPVGLLRSQVVPRRGVSSQGKRRSTYTAPSLRSLAARADPTPPLSCRPIRSDRRAPARSKSDPTSSVCTQSPQICEFVRANVMAWRTCRRTWSHGRDNAAS